MRVQYSLHEAQTNQIIWSIKAAEPKKSYTLIFELHFDVGKLSVGIKLTCATHSFSLEDKTHEKSFHPLSANKARF